ncbi:hypothetical protein DC74_p00015 (plasmid) [Streptomyces noursei]|nr:hypothetical protein DC74_p00015 [Streptomyces noursei]
MDTPEVVDIRWTPASTGTTVRATAGAVVRSILRSTVRTTGGTGRPGADVECPQVTRDGVSGAAADTSSLAGEEDVLPVLEDGTRTSVAEQVGAGVVLPASPVGAEQVVAEDRRTPSTEGGRGRRAAPAGPDCTPGSVSRCPESGQPSARREARRERVSANWAQFAGSAACPAGAS